MTRVQFTEHDWVAELAECEDAMPTGLQERIMADPEVVPRLIEVIEAETAEPKGEWLPLHATNLLAELRDERAAAPLVRLLCSLDDDDSLGGPVMSAIHELGPAAVEPLVAKLAERETGHPWTLLDVVARLGIRDDRFFNALLAELEESPDFIAGCLAEYGDARAVSHLHRVLASRELADNPLRNHAVVELGAAIEHLGDTLSDAERRKVAQAGSGLHDEDLFGDDGFDDEYDEYDGAPRRMPVLAPQRPGRNEPCSCGSGKKYKHCHWKQDQLEQ